MRSWLYVVCVVFTTLTLGAADGGAASGVQGEADRFLQMYFAPMDAGNFFRLYAPGTGMVEFRKNWRHGNIEGAGGWSAVEADGGVTIREPGSPLAYTFRKGRPFALLASDGKWRNTKFEGEPEIPGKIPPMWEGAKEDALEAVVNKFSGPGARFRLFYVNPNHAAMLLAELALLGLFVFLYAPWKWKNASPLKLTLFGGAILAGAAGFAAAAYFLVKTDGRGGALGLALGILLLLGFRFFRPGGKVRAALVSALVVAVVWVFCVGTGFGGRFSAKTMTHGYSSRSEEWRQVPRMMVDSPWGWGGARAGRVYSDWYQPLSSSMVTPSLDSDHLTYMTEFGWFGRFVWGFVWLAALFSFFRFAAGGGSPLPLAIFSALGLAAMFNPILLEWSLWIVPVASLWPFAASRPWKVPRRYLVPFASAAAVSLLVCAAFYWAGREPSRLAVLSITADGGRVCVGSRNPDVWVADDRYSLGWLFAPKAIRHFYSAHPGAKPLGYVQRLSDVPSRVRRLAVAGGLCREYVKRWLAGDAPKVDELVFLSPGMPLDAVPESLRRSCRFAFVVGEFAARYKDVYGQLFAPDGNARDGVLVTEGAEVYQPGWVGLILSM